MGGFWALLGVSWAAFGCLLGALGRIWALMGGSGLDLEGFQEAPGRVLEPPGMYFSRFLHACALVVGQQVCRMSAVSKVIRVSRKSRRYRALATLGTLHFNSKSKQQRQEVLFVGFVPVVLKEESTPALSEVR